MLNKMATGQRITKIAAIAMFAAASVTGAMAQSVEEFYKGKTIQIIISTGSGTGHDMGVRLVGKHMERHIPGKPVTIVRSMPGGGHVLAANYVYANAPKDGTTIGSILPAFILHQVIDGRGVQYKAEDFPWIGSSDVDNMNFYLWHTANIKTIEDAKTKVGVMGATGAGSYTALFPTLLNNLLGTKFRIVPGYRTTGEIHIAMERGEVQGRAGNFNSSLKSANPDWLRDKKVDIIMQIGAERDPEFPDVPLMTELAQTPEQKRVLELFSGEIAMGRAFLATPGIPADRLAALRKAFEDTMKDPQYIAEAKSLDLPVRPLGHERLAEIAKSILTTPPDLIEIGRKAKFGNKPPQ
jgi:tripartite-type tricarboxylate transporter receptor subunit TctC